MFHQKRHNLGLVQMVSLLLTACAAQPGLHDSSEAIGGVAGLDDTMPIGCRYEKVWQDGHQQGASDWLFIRDRGGQRTETRDESSHQGEVWERDEAGRLSLMRVFFQEKVVLEYPHGDLKAANRLPVWPTVWSIVNPSQLGHELRLVATNTVDGVRVESYTGVINGVKTEIDWLPALKLPARHVRHESTGMESLSLISCKPLSLGSIKPTDVAQLDSYRHIDYTDLGDMESDPVVHRIEMLSGESHHHHD